MAMFVHIAPAERVEKIKRNGIRRLRKPRGTHSGGIFATPVTPNFYVSHQWLRELRRRGHRTFVGIYFRVPDDTPVWLGHYGREHREMPASAAVAEFLRADDKLGWEVVIPRAIEAKEIHRVRDLPQVLGWRVYPEAKGHKPCGCYYCAYGQYGATKRRRKYEEQYGDR